MKSNLWLPESARDPEPVRKMLSCFLCGGQWPPEQAVVYQAHFKTCIREHQDEIQRRSEENKQSIFRPWDPEIAAHMERVGETMKREGRLEVRPNERAGFS